jgi:hypothetical protein
MRIHTGYPRVEDMISWGGGHDFVTYQKPDYKEQGQLTVLSGGFTAYVRSILPTLCLPAVGSAF